MTQLIIDGVVLPESRKGGYTANYQALAEDVEMITGRMVRELRGSVWVITYQYGYFDDTLKNQVIAACEKGKRQSIECGFLTPDSTGELQYSNFIVTSFAYPKFMWSRLIDGQVENEEGEMEDGLVPTPMWGDFQVELREVEPSD